MVQGSLRLTVSIPWLSKPTTCLLSNQTRKDHPPYHGAGCFQHSDQLSSMLMLDTVSVDRRACLWYPQRAQERRDLAIGFSVSFLDW